MKVPQATLLPNMAKKKDKKDYTTLVAICHVTHVVQSSLSFFFYQVRSYNEYISSQHWELGVIFNYRSVMASTLFHHLFQGIQTILGFIRKCFNSPNSVFTKKPFIRHLSNRNSSMHHPYGVHIWRGSMPKRATNFILNDILFGYKSCLLPLKNFPISSPMNQLISCSSLSSSKTLITTSASQIGSIQIIRQCHQVLQQA